MTTNRGSRSEPVPRVLLVLNGKEPTTAPIVPETIFAKHITVAEDYGNQ